jgi:hypothetical protein
LSGVSKSLVGVGNHQLGTKDSNVTFLFLLRCEGLNLKCLVPIDVSCMCGYGCDPLLFRVLGSYNTNMGLVLWTMESVVVLITQGRRG